MGLNDNFILRDYKYKQTDLITSECIFFPKAFMSTVEKHIHLSVL